jgi:hypothetical protein
MGFVLVCLLGGFRVLWLFFDPITRGLVVLSRVAGRVFVVWCAHGRVSVNGSDSIIVPVSGQADSGVKDGINTRWSTGRRFLFPD